LFDTADSTRSGVLEWNTGEVVNFGKAVLESYGRNTEGSETLLYNAYDDVDRNLDAKMTLAEGLEFAKKVLEYSSPSSPASKSQPSRLQTSVFDTQHSSASTQNVERTVPYSGMVLTENGPMPYGDLIKFTRPQSFDECIDKEFDSMDAALARQGPIDSSTAEYIQDLEAQTVNLAKENDRLTVENSNLLSHAEENKILLQQLNNIASGEHSQALNSAELARAHEANEELSKVCANLEQQIMVLEKSQGAPMSEEQMSELERQNQGLLQHIQNLQSQEHSSGNLSEQLAQAHEENAHLAMLLKACEAEPGSRKDFKGDSKALADLEERERIMDAEISKLQAENARLRQEMSSRPAETAGVEKKKKFLCC
jgi:hypothetical protein